MAGCIEDNVAMRPRHLFDLVRYIPVFYFYIQLSNFDHDILPGRYRYIFESRYDISQVSRCGPSSDGHDW